MILNPVLILYTLTSSMPVAYGFHVCVCRCVHRICEKMRKEKKLSFKQLVEMPAVSTPVEPLGDS